jgi:hypothetical protein
VVLYKNKKFEIYQAMGQKYYGNLIDDYTTTEKFLIDYIEKNML